MQYKVAIYGSNDSKDFSMLDKAVGTFDEMSENDIIRSATNIIAQNYLSLKRFKHVYVDIVKK